MSDPQSHLQKIRTQFTRQADAYMRMQQTTDEVALGKLIALTRVQSDQRVLDVACGPGFLTMGFAQRCTEAIGFDATSEFLIRAQEEAARRGLRNIASCTNSRNLGGSADCLSGVPESNMHSLAFSS